MIEILYAIAIIIGVIVVGIFIFVNAFNCTLQTAFLYSIYVFTTLGPAPIQPETWWQNFVLGFYSLISTLIFVGIIAFLIGTFIIARYIQSDLDEHDFKLVSEEGSSD